MKKAAWFIKNSVILDLKFLASSRWGIFKKIDFLIAKYFLIIKHFFKKFRLGEDHVIFRREKIYYDSQYGMAGYQSILARHQKLMKLAGIKKADVVIDVGANVGFFSKLCRDIFPESSIYAFEPVPQIFKCLWRNFENDKKTKCFNAGLADFEGTAKMRFSENESAISAIDDDGNVAVEIWKLDDFVKENDITAIDILKIDTETFEAHVLRGSRHVLSKVKFMFLEITMDDNKNYTLASLMKMLSTEEYDFQLIGFRNYADVAEGKMPIMDALIINTKL